MYSSAFSKFYYGFIFILLDFKVQGFDIFPDIIGYILFAFSFSALVSQSEYFRKASYVNIPMIFLSALYIYEPQSPAQPGINFSFGPFGILGIPIAIASIVLSIMVVYYLFQGIIEMARVRGAFNIVDEAEHRWRQFLYLQVAAILVFALIFVPFLIFFYFIGLIIASIALVIVILNFMRKCKEYF